MAEIVEGPWPKRQERRLAKGRDAAAKLKEMSRLPLADRKRMAENLGDMIAALSEGSGASSKIVMRQVFENSGSAHNWAKRLRFVRFSSDIEKKSDEFSSSFADFLKLAKEALRLRSSTSITEEQLENEATLRLLAGTSSDPDPFHNAKIDFDAARALGSLADAFVQQVEQAVPSLKTYFERVAKYQLFHKPWPEEVYKERFINPIQDPGSGLYDNWSAQLFGFIPCDVDTSKFFRAERSEPDPFEPFVSQYSLLFRQVPSEEPYEPIHGNSLPVGMLTDGFCIIGGSGENHAAVPGLLPKIYLGDIYPVKGNRSNWQGALRPTRVYVALAPTMAEGKLRIKLAVISEAWPYDSPEYTFEDGRVYIGSSGHDTWIGDQNELVATKEWVEREGPIPIETLDLPEYSVETVDFIPGVKANITLGLQSDMPVSLRHANNSAEVDSENASDKARYFAGIGFAIEAGTGFTPFHATSLAAAFVSNLLYVKDERSVLNMMIADAKSRVETLERQFQEWMADFQAVRSEFVDGGANKNGEE